MAPHIINRATLRGGGGYCPQCCDCDEIEKRLTQLENSQCDCEFIYSELRRLDRATEISTVRRVTRAEPGSAMQGITTAVLSIGPTYNYWGEGTLASTHASWGQGTYYLVSNAEFPELLNYQGDATIGTAWFAMGGQSTPTPIPIFADATGIYIQPRGANPNDGTYFKFTLTLILADPNSSSK
jgi:hypothetical protein